MDTGQARAQLETQLDHVEAAYRDGIDRRYAIDCLQEALGDYLEALSVRYITGKLGAE